MEKTSDKIRKLRTSKYLTQQQLADHLHVTKQAISKWEKGKSIPDITSVELIASFFGVSVDYLINDSIEDVKHKAAGASSKPFENQNKLITALTAALVILLAAVIALSVSLGVLAQKSKPDYSVEVRGLVFTYLSDETDHSDSRIDLSFNVYNPGSDGIQLVEKNFTVNNGAHITILSPSPFKYGGSCSVAGREEVTVYIGLWRPDGFFGKRTATIKYAGQPIATIKW